MGIGFDRNGFLTIMVVYLNQPFLYTSWWLTNEVSIIENVEMGSTFKPPNQKKYIWLYSPIVRMICTQKRVVVTLLLPCQIMISFALSSEAHTVGGGGYGNSSPPLYHWNLWFFRPPIGALPPPSHFWKNQYSRPHVCCFVSNKRKNGWSDKSNTVGSQIILPERITDGPSRNIVILSSLVGGGREGKQSNIY